MGIVIIAYANTATAAPTCDVIFHGLGFAPVVDPAGVPGAEVITPRTRNVSWHCHGLNPGKLYSFSSVSYGPPAGFGDRIHDIPDSPRGLAFQWTLPDGSVLTGDVPRSVPGGVYGRDTWMDSTDLVGTAVYSGSPLVSGRSSSEHIRFVLLENGVEVPTDPAMVLSINLDLVVPTPPTCTPSLASKRITVDLGTYSTRDVTGAGGVTPWKPFDLQLDCGGGAGGLSTRIHVTLTDLADPGNTSVNLPLVGSLASGIAVQIGRDDGSLINFGPDQSGIGHPGQWLAGEVGPGDALFKIPLKARFTQTSATIEPGAATAVASFTLEYD